MKKILTLITIWLCADHLIGQTTYSAEVEAQIKQVENNLAGGWVKIEGSEPYNISDEMAYHNVKGVSIALIQNYKMVWAKGYGWADENEKIPVTNKTLFMAGSMSKSINGMGILKLAQDKKIDLNADINEYLASWKFPYDSVSNGKKITTLNLLSHSAGINNNGRPLFYLNDTIPTLIELLNGTPGSEAEPTRSIMEPGIKYEYSNNGAGIAQLLITDITKKSYDKYISESVFKPLKMTNSYYTEQSLIKQKNSLATGYTDRTEVPGKHVITPMQSSGGLWTTPTDLCKFIIELQLAYIGKSEKVLTREMTGKILTPYLDKSAALGVFIIEKGNTKYFAHRGGVIGMQGKYYGSLEDGNGVVVMTNSENGIVIVDEIMNSVAAVYNWQGYYEPVVKKVVAVHDSILQKYSGIYMMEKDNFIYFSNKQDGFYQRVHGVVHKTYFTGETDFFNMKLPAEGHFLADTSGKVTGYVNTAYETQRTAVKLSTPDTLNAPYHFFYNAGWCFMEDKNYEEAIKYYKRGLALYPDTLSLELELAHSYLFKNDYDSALKLYKVHLNETLPNGLVWNEMIGQAFVWFKNNAFDKTPMDRVFADLKLEIPKAYKN